MRADGRLREIKMLTGRAEAQSEARELWGWGLSRKQVYRGA